MLTIASITFLVIQNLMANQAIGSHLGVEVSDRPSAFVDLARVTRPFQAIDGDALVPVDEKGFPKSAFWTVFMDDRAPMAWAPPIDDPTQFQPKESGTYKLRFHGIATVTPSHGSPVTVANLSYDSKANETTADVTLNESSPNLIILDFKNARRSPNGLPGLSDLHLFRPGYPTDGSMTFTREFIKSLKPFAYLRFMGWLDTNFDAGYYGDKGHHLIQWEDRTKPTDSIQGMPGLRPGTHGISWETCVELANLVHKDLWINVPISATGATPNDTDSYVYRLAELIKAKLDPNLNIYVEHSNEVWNFGFRQYIWNKLAAIDEVQQGKSPLNGDGSTDQEQWSRRRHALRLYQFARVFEKVFGKGSLNHRVRPVYAGWTIQPDWYDEVLTWLEKLYGPSKDYFYCLAGTGYFNDQGAHGTESPDQVIAAMTKDSVDGLRYTVRLMGIANKHGLKLAQYEAGPDSGGGDTHNIGNRIVANRMEAMGDLVYKHFKERFFDIGGDLSTYFALSSGFSRYGCWGATDDLKNLDTAKYRAILRLVQAPLGKSNVTAKAMTDLMAPVINVSHLNDGGIQITWKLATDSTYTIWTTEGGNYVVAAKNLKTNTWSTKVTPGSHSFYVVRHSGNRESRPSNTVIVEVK